MNEHTVKQRENTGSGRDHNGRFASGNSGRPHGAKGRVTKLASEILDDAVGDIAKKAVQMARAGNVTCIGAVLKLRIPALKEAPQEPIELPALDSAESAVACLREIAMAAALGSIDGDRARALANVVQTFVETHKAANLEQRIAALEAASQSTKDSSK